MTETTRFLESRRSIPIPALGLPAPDDTQIEAILTIASRVPDHGKLAPWRFVVYRGDIAVKIGKALAAVAEARDGPLGEGRREMEERRFSRSPLVIGIVSTAKPHVKIPEWEQELSAGAVCMNLLHAVHAEGYVGGWLTGWPAYSDAVRDGFGAAPERIAGFLFAGTPSRELDERPRPAPGSRTTLWNPTTS